MFALLSCASEAAGAAGGLGQAVRLVKLRREERQDHELGDAVAGQDRAGLIRANQRLLLWKLF